MITGATEPRPAPRAVAAWVPWVVTPIIALTLSASLDAVDLVAPDPLGGTSSRYVPPEGHRSVTISADGVETITEHSRSIGIEGAFAAPLTIAASLLSSVGEETLPRAQWWRATRVASGGDRTTDLYRLTDQGVTQVASWGGTIGFVFEPEIVLLPAEVQPGDAWSGSGSALADGALSYAIESVAFAATGPFTDADGRDVPLTGGCIGVDSTLRIESSDDGLSTVLVESTVWCPGRGAVWASGTVDGQPVGQAEVRPAALQPVAASTESVGDWRSVVDESSTLGPGRELALTIEDPFFGASEASGQFWVAPTSTADGRLVTANDRGDDLQVWGLDRTGAELAWAGHPGGTIVSVGVAGDLVLATTARRRVVAYDSSGRRLWNWAADELSIASPRQLGADVLVVTRSGMVTALDAETGVPRWSTSLGADARSAVAVVDDVVLVADERERLSAVDPATGELLWRRDVGLVETLAADASASAVVAMTEAGEVLVLELADGSERFSATYPGIAEGIAFGSGSIVTLSDERIVAVDARDGVERWRGEGGSSLVGGGARVAIVRQGSLLLRSTDDGAVVDEQAFDSGFVSSSVAAIAVGPAVVLFESDGRLQRWEVR